MRLWGRGGGRDARETTSEVVAAADAPLERGAPSEPYGGEAPWYVESGTDPSRFVGADGPTLRLRPYTDSGGVPNLRLVDTTSGLLVGPTDRRLVSAGVLSVPLKGEKFYAGACKAGDFRPGAPVSLITEPNNEHDPLAVAVFDAAGKHLCGYLSRQKARAFHKMVSEFGALTAISVRGTPPGKATDSIAVVGASPEVLATLLSAWPIEAPEPRF